MNQKTPYLPYWFDTVLAKSPRTTRNKQNVYSNLYSQAVTHPSTNRSQPCLTSVIGRELVFSRWYGRRYVKQLNNQVSVESKKSENQDWYSRCFQGDIRGKSRSGEPTWLYVCIRIRSSGLHWPRRKLAVFQLLLWYTPLKKCYQAV